MLPFPDGLPFVQIRESDSTPGEKAGTYSLQLQRAQVGSGDGNGSTHIVAQCS